MYCAYHLCDNILTGKQTRFCSSNCKNKFHVILRRKKLKEMAIEYKGGKCAICSYDKCHAALEFHHLDPAEKDFGISAAGHSRSWQRIKAELDKCIMVCSNCHQEIHSGLVAVGVGLEPT